MLTVVAANGKFGALTAHSKEAAALGETNWHKGRAEESGMGDVGGLRRGRLRKGETMDRGAVGCNDLARRWAGNQVPKLCVSPKDHLFRARLGKAGRVRHTWK